MKTLHSPDKRMKCGHTSPLKLLFPVSPWSTSRNPRLSLRLGIELRLKEAAGFEGLEESPGGPTGRWERLLALRGSRKAQGDPQDAGNPQQGWVRVTESSPRNQQVISLCSGEAEVTGGQREGHPGPMPGLNLMPPRGVGDWGWLKAKDPHPPPSPPTLRTGTGEEAEQGNRESPEGPITLRFQPSASWPPRPCPQRGPLRPRPSPTGSEAPEDPATGGTFGEAGAAILLS